MQEERAKNKPIDSNVKLFGKFEFMAKEKKIKRRTGHRRKVEDENDLLLAAAVDVSNANISNVVHFYNCKITIASFNR